MEFSDGVRQYSVGLMSEYNSTVRMSVVSWRIGEFDAWIVQQLPAHLIQAVGEWMAELTQEKIDEALS